VIQHISFDVWLTLIRSNPAYKPARNDLIINYFGIVKDIKTVNETFQRFDRHFTKVNEIVGKNLDSREMLLIILADLGVEIEKLNHSILDHYEKELLQLFWRFPPLLIEQNFFKIAEKLVKQNISLSILSNTGFIKGKILRALLEHYDLQQFFAFQCYSDEANCSKPSHQFFELAYHNILIIKSLEKKQVLHVGDNPIADVRGATEFGFQSAHYVREIIGMEKLLEQHGIY
jgi:putative hydrolase of the HAD superfamily